VGYEGEVEQPGSAGDGDGLGTGRRGGSAFGA
jgi:hypothetical protein